MMQDWYEIEKVLEELKENQKKNLFKCALKINPQITEEDLLQPQDCLLLETHPYFRYEEGILLGIQTVQAALRALKKTF